MRLKESYPKLKVSLFTIPYDFAYERAVEGRIMRAKTLKRIKEELDWLEIIPHGLTHMPREFEKCTYDTMKLSIKAIDDVFKKDGLPYVKGFKAPYWLWNSEVTRALDDEGWWGAIDKHRKKDDAITKKVYVYNHTIDEWFSESTLDVLKLHGHIPNVEHNGLETCFTNLFNMPTNAEFKFASEMLTDGPEPVSAYFVKKDYEYRKNEDHRMGE